MTRLILDIPNEPDVDVLLPLLRRFGVVVSRQKPVSREELKRLHAIIDAGADLPGAVAKNSFVNLRKVGNFHTSTEPC